MKRWKSFAAAGIFVLLTVLKLALPQHSAGLRERVLYFIDRDDDYVELAQTLGSHVTESRFGEKLVEVFGRAREDKTPPSPSPEPMLLPRTLSDSDETAPTFAEQTPSPSPSPTPAPTPTPTPTPSPTPTPEPVPTSSPEPTPEPSEQPEAVSAFLSSQAEFDGYAIPANVRTDMPEIPFEYTSPVDGYDSSGFGYRVHPIQGTVKFHYGTDFAADSGDSVSAFADGYVYAAGESDSYGKYLILTHEGGFASLYAHLSEFVAHEGDMVERGQTIGRVGQTGKATGPHLHFELFLNDVYINPEYYV